MSRIGKQPVAVPANVEVTIDGHNLTVKGPKGELHRSFNPMMTIAREGDEIIVSRPDDSREAKSLHGLTRTLIHNMVEGVTKGFEKSLIVNGVGWKVNMQGEKLVLNVGFSHPVEFTAIPGVKLAAPSATEITVSGINKTDVGQVAASIRAIRKPEPYHGYGIRYKDEVIERKAGKTAGK